MKTIINHLLVFSFLLYNVACVKQEKTESTESLTSFCIPDSMMQNITLDTVKMASVLSELKLSGKITYNEDHIVKVYPVVSGHVAEVKVSLGDYVEKGQLLAIVHSVDMANYNNEYKSAQSELAVAKKNMEVIRDMQNSGVSSEKDYLNAQSTYQKALAAFNKINDLLKIYGGSSKNDDSVASGYSIKAPSSGFIVEKNINAGQELRADDSNQLFTITDLKEVWAIANVYETDIAKIKTGSDALITTLSYPDKQFSGKVDRISNILNQESNSMTLKIRLSNADYSLKPGMFANVSILFPDHKKLPSISSKSVLFDDNRNYVVLYRKRCDLEMKLVTLLKSFNDVSYLQGDSLHEGDLIVQRNGLFIFTALKKR